MNNLSPDASAWLDREIANLTRLVVARAAVLSAQSKDEIVQRSHVETAWNEVNSGRSYKKGLWVAVGAAVGTILVALVTGFFNGFGKGIADFLLKPFR